MAYSKSVWSQIKGLTADHIIKALEKDDWVKDTKVGASVGSIFTYIKMKNNEISRVQVHWHPKKTYGPKLIKNLITIIGWSEEDMRRLKLISRH